MMNVYNPTELLAPLPGDQEQPPFRWVPAVMRFLRRRRLGILASGAAGMVLAIVYLQLATPQYAATTALLVDLRQSNPFRQQPIATDAQSDNTLVESQVEVLRSEGLARAVVVQHDLTNDRAFNSIGRGIIGSAIGLVADLFPAGNGGAADRAARQAVAVEMLQRMVAVRRVGLTAVIEVSARTPDPELSARLANMLVETHLQRQLGALADVSTLASGWMQKRVVELRDQAITADRAVQEYRAAHNILDTDKGQFNAQQLGDFSQQLVSARASLAEAQAKFDRISGLSPDRMIDAPLSEAIENSVIVGLRRQYLEARRRESEWSSRYGAGHAAAANARTEMAELQQSIRNELRRISETYRSELEVAKAKEAELSRQLGVLAGAAAEANTDRIMLRALQSAADSYKSIYENFLQRYTQAVQDQSFPIAEARVMSRAVPPHRKIWPKAPVVLIGGLLGGVLLGLGLAILREVLDQGLRTPAQIRAATGQDCLGMLPRLLSAAHRGDPGQAAEPSLRLLSTRPSALRHVVDQPGSPFAEAMRGIALRTVWRRHAPGCQVIGCVAPRPGEGTSTVAANLAYAFAEAGYNTLLVDLDLRSGALTRALAPQNGGGVAEIAEGALPLEQAVWRDPQLGLHFLPSAAGRSAAQPARVLSPLRAERLLAALRAGYDRVVIDLPPAGTTADAGVLAELLDGLLLVSTWGGLEGEALAEILEDLHAGRDRLLGIVLNRVELGRLEQYGVAAHLPAPRRHAAMAA